VPDAPEPPADIERRIVSVLFADLVGFTPLAERLDSEDVATIQDAYFAAVRETIGRYGGVLEKFIGDAAMAVFGAPVSRDDDAERAVRAGLALLGAVEQLAARLGLGPGELQLRVGVNSGEVVHALTGPDAGRVTGDTVNTAARLQAAAAPGMVLLGEFTALATASAIELRQLEPIELKGKAEPVRCSAAIGVRPQPSREEALGGLRAPMLGRDGELARLRDAVRAAREGGTAHRLLIVAPPGVGKSRLLTELGMAEASATTVLHARVRPQATAPYETVAQLLAGAPDAHLEAALVAAGVPSARVPVVVAEVARLQGRDQPGAAVGAIGAADLGAEREARFDAWLTAIDALAPTTEVWLVEDVHWAGGDLLAFLERAGRAGGRHGRLVVATGRPSLLESAPEWCDTDRLDLAALPDEDAATLVEALIGPALPEPVLRAVVDRSDGTPLFIEELLRTWASVGILARDGDRWGLTVEPDAVTLPATVQAIYAAQLDDLPVEARLVARRGSVAGRRIPVAALGALEAGTSDGLEGLLRRALLAGPVHDPITGVAYAYRHALLRDAGYASLARIERSRLHLAMARWLAATAGDRADTVAEGVAEHYALALDSLPALAHPELPAREQLAADAASWFERAAEAAERLAAPDAGCRLFARAIARSDGEQPTTLSRRRRRLGEVLAASADLDAGIAELEGALTCCPDDPESVAAAAYALGRAYMQQIRFGEAERLLSETLTSVAGAPERLRARLHALHAWAVSAQGRVDGVLDETVLARAMAARSGDPLLELQVLEHTSAARDELDAASEDDWAELEERARALGAWHQVVAAARIRATYVATHDPEAALASLETTADLAHAHGQLEQAGWCDYARCELLWVMGRWDEAMSIGLAVVDVAERNAYERLAFRTWVVVLPMAAERRLSEPADRYRQWWTTARDHFPVAASPYGRLLTGAIDAWIALAHGRQPAEPPGDLVETVIPMLNPHFLAGVETVVQGWLAHGRSELAGAAAERMAGFDDATPMMRASRALVDAWTGREDAAVAVAAAREVAAPWWLSRALRAAGELEEAAEIEARLGIPSG